LQLELGGLGASGHAWLDARSFLLASLFVTSFACCLSLQVVLLDYWLSFV
jgi:hypothetical protein